MKKLYHLFLLLLPTATLIAQPSYDKEKIFIHTDHVFYKPGATVFFKTYLVTGSDNKPSPVSKVVYVEFNGPSGSLIEKQTYQVDHGYCEGSYTLPDNATGGQYSLKAYTTWMKNETDSTFFTKQFTVQQVISPRILMKLEFPRKGYGPGDTAIAEFSMRTLGDQPIKDYRGKFTVLLAGQPQEVDSFTTDDKGKCRINFILPTNLNTTDGLLNCTVSYDSYTESIARAIPITLNKIDLQFLPEGGSFVTGLSTHLAFKAINEYGDPVDIRGFIRDNDGQIVTDFETYKFGMGIVPFTPRPGKTYTAIITTPKNIKETYPLPSAAKEGIVLNIQQASDSLTINLQTTAKKTVYLVGRLRGVSYYSRSLSLSKGTNEIPINVSEFPQGPGIAQFTLYAENKTPLAERLIFLHLNKRLHITLLSDKTTYGPREKVTIKIKTTDEDGAAIPANLSLSVVDDKLWTLADDKQDNILSWLSLHSELSGKIEEPSFYFKTNEPKAAEALDLVLLTNGYRYFDFIPEVLQKDEMKYTPDESNMASGLLSGKKHLPIPGTVYLIQNTTGGKVWKDKTTDGRFNFSGLQPGTSYVLVAEGAKKTNPPTIQLLQNGLGSSTTSPIKLRVNDPLPPLILPLQPPPAKALPAAKAPPPFTPLGQGNQQHLDEVVVVGYGYANRRDVTGSVSIVRANTLLSTPANDLLQTLSGKVPGLQITTNGNTGLADKIMIRGMGNLNHGNEPLIVIDGVPHEKYDLAGLDVNSIESVEVMKDAAGVALFGARAASGVILIRTKTFYYRKIKLNLVKGNNYNILSFTEQGPGYTVARRFYAPKYGSKTPEERNDFRETIEWAPVVQTDSNGEAKLQFYNSDATTTFRALVQGIGDNGLLGVADTTYAVRAALNIDVKIPPYLTTGDRALLPVVIKNNTGSRLEGTLTISLPAGFKTDSINRTISLDTGVSKEILTPVTATEPTSGTIRFTVASNQGTETTALPITVAQKGFPVIQTFSAVSTSTHHFIVKNTIPGSLHAQLRVYKNVESQLVDGIASMLREPYGCFEQTSSTTYPNIFILKYLRRVGRSNPEIEKKALDYIEKGYKRLIGFETPEHGFEWFGHAPAHESLTAYGLLEFTDMQEFLAVDQKMLQRTKAFLLQRRDGLGGFRLATNGLDEFASVPAKIANIYIVYAMSQAGYGREILPEYEAAVKKAMESKDAYQLAMMALAADNLKKAVDYNMLMDALRTTYPNRQLKAETSVVNSRDASLRIETRSLFALALMRDKSPDIGGIAELMAKILGEKCYYGYGSTQATLFALNALSEYAVLTAGKLDTSDIRFTLNDHIVTSNDNLSAVLHEGENEFTATYPDAHHGLPYSLEVGYNTLTPPNSDKAELRLSTTINNNRPSIGETDRLTVKVENTKDQPQPMAIAKIGIPAGLSLQTWQLKDLVKEKKIAYYELFDNYLVLYWLGLAANQTLTVPLDLKADIPGTYRGKASTVYLYYTPEYKHWNEGLAVDISSHF